MIKEGAGLKYLVYHWLITNTNIAITNFFFFFRQNHIQSFYFGIATIDFQRNIRYLQSMKERMLVKRNWRKSHIIFHGENKHLVTTISCRTFIIIFYHISDLLAASLMQQIVNGSNLIKWPFYTLKKRRSHDKNIQKLTPLQLN